MDEERRGQLLETLGWLELKFRSFLSFALYVVLTVFVLRVAYAMYVTW